MEGINSKLDKILDTLTNLTERINSIENRLASNTERVSELDLKLTKRCDNIEESSVKCERIEALEKKFDFMQASIDKKTDDLEKLTDECNVLKTKLQMLKHETEQELLANEIYSKRFNILVHGIEENKENAWETKCESEDKFRSFLTNALKIPNSHEIVVADVHRLPQHSVSKHGRRITRPIIAKLTSYVDKNLIMKSLKNLKSFNQSRKDEFGDRMSYVYVTEHLPRELQFQKKRLLPAFKKAKSQGKRAVFKIEHSSYCLYIDNVKYDQPLNEHEAAGSSSDSESN